MKKSKLTLGIMASLVTVMSLVACSNNPRWGSDGNVVTLTNPDGTQTNIKADQIFDEYTHEVSGTKTMFDTVYELIVRNYFTQDGQKSNLADDKKKADNELSGLKSDANTKANTNKTSYNEEFEKILDENGVDSEEELRNKLEYKYMKSDFEDQFYKNYLNDDKNNPNGNLRDGFKIGDQNYEGYLEQKIPYHVKHILVKVSASNGSFYNGEITKDEAIKLSKTVELLANGGQWDFGSVANLLSDDTSSKTNYGDLGIMDKDTSYINEFKLGIYAYDSFYNNDTSANKDRIGIPTAETDFFDTDAIGQIPYGVFEELNKDADIEKDSESHKVNDGQAFYYPRNVYFNKYLNNHMVSVIVPNDLPAASELYTPDATTGKASGTEAYVGARNTTYADLPGFVSTTGKVSNINFINNTDQKVLCDEEGRVILAVRGGSTGSNAYEGVHFIVVERSALKDIEHIVTASKGEYDVSLSEYYTTHYPTETEYPTYDYNGNTYNKDTYVNMLDLETSELKARANTVENKIKQFEPLLNTYIYQIFAQEQSIAFHGDEGLKIKEAIESYITTQRAKEAYDDESTWNVTWQNYMEYLEQQANERSKDKLLSATCAIQYQDTTKGNGWNKGGMCGYDSGK